MHKHITKPKPTSRDRADLEPIAPGLNPEVPPQVKDEGAKTIAEMKPTPRDGNDMAQRMSAVEEALTLQLMVGTSHLQAIEMAPERYGLTNRARPEIKQIRQRRNWALHSVTKPNGSETGDEVIARCKSDRNDWNTDESPQAKKEEEDSKPTAVTKPISHDRCRKASPQAKEAESQTTARAQPTSRDRSRDASPQLAEPTANLPGCDPEESPQVKEAMAWLRRQEELMGSLPLEAKNRLAHLISEARFDGYQRQ